MRLSDLLSYISENENVYVWLDGKIVAEYNGRDSISLKYNDFEVEKETLRKAVQMIKYRDKVLDLVLRLESGEVENYAENN